MGSLLGSCSFDQFSSFLLQACSLGMSQFILFSCFIVFLAGFFLSWGYSLFELSAVILLMSISMGFLLFCLDWVLLYISMETALLPLFLSLIFLSKRTSRVGAAYYLLFITLFTSIFYISFLVVSFY